MVQIKKSLFSRAINYIGNHPLVGLIALGVGICSLGLYIRDRTTSSMSGVLKSSGSATRKYFSVGQLASLLTRRTTCSFGMEIDRSFRYAVANQKLLVTTEIRNSAGELIAELKDNEWKVKSRFVVRSQLY